MPKIMQYLTYFGILASEYASAVHIKISFTTYSLLILFIIETDNIFWSFQ